MAVYVIYNNEQIGNKFETIWETEQKCESYPLPLETMSKTKEGDQVIVYDPATLLLAICFAEETMQKSTMQGKIQKKSI